MALKCPNCGYENTDAALSCNLCQTVLRKEQKQAAPAAVAGAPLPSEPKVLDTIESWQAIMRLAMGAVEQDRVDEAGRLMSRLFLEVSLGDCKVIIQEGGKIWLAAATMAADQK